MKIYKKIGVGLICLSMSTLISCTSVNYGLKSKKEEVTNYNNLVQDTMKDYSAERAYAESVNSHILQFALNDWKLDIMNGLSFTPLTEEEKQAFTMYAIVSDNYFTSLGSEGVREVIIINGKQKHMIVNLIWKGNKVIDVNRRVINNE
ncbi:hypothetical protein D3C81_10330 [compost metagenome]